MREWGSNDEPWRGRRANLIIGIGPIGSIVRLPFCCVMLRILGHDQVFPLGCKRIKLVGCAGDVRNERDRRDSRRSRIYKNPPPRNERLVPML
jgi:hypothetical protein